MKLISTIPVLVCYVSCISAVSETEKIKGVSVKVGKTKFSCTFTLVNDGAAVLLSDSKVACTPNKPTKKKVNNFAVSTDKADYKLSFKINPEQLTSATIELKTVTCDPGFTRVCPSGAAGACPADMFNFCPYHGSPPDAADTWACACLPTRMLELDVYEGISPLGECHGECICLSGSVQAIMSKQKPAFHGPGDMPSYCNN